MAQENNGKMDPVKIIALVTAIVSLTSAGLSCRKASLELAARTIAEDTADRERARADAAALRVKELEKAAADQIDAIRKFMAFYGSQLKEIRDAQSRLADYRASPNATERVPAAEAELGTKVAAFVKFVSEWKAVHERLGELLNGDVSRLSLAMSQGDLAAVERARQILEANAPAKLALLEEAVRQLTRPSP